MGAQRRSIGRACVRAACRALCAAVAWLPLAGAVAAAAPGRTVVEGVVASSAGEVFLLAGQESRVAVFLERATLLEGIEAAWQIDQGDRVRVEVRVRAPGYVVADRVRVLPRSAPNGSPPYVSEDRSLPPAPGAKRARVVDGRPPGAFARGHVPGAIPVGRPERRSPLPCAPGEELLLCGADGYGEEVLALYQELARTECDVRILRGGTSGYARRGMPLVTEAAGVPAPGERGALVVDVRSAAEYARGHVPGAYSLPFEEMDWKLLSSPVGMPPLVFYGRDAADDRAVEAARRTLGWRHQKHSKVDGAVSWLAGGFAAWLAEGRPAESGDGRGRLTPEATRDPDEVAAEELDRLWWGDPPAIVLVDLREVPGEPGDGVIPIALEQLPARLSELPRDREVVVFCSQGIRSRIAVGILRAHGLRARFTREPGSR